MIHQVGTASYLRVLELAVAKTLSKLIVSRYEQDEAGTQANRMTYYFEPLAEVPGAEEAISHDRGNR
jgi:hypothetical protein